MRIEYLGHACFLVSGEKKILFDPFDGELGYGDFRRSCDVLCVSHSRPSQSNIHAAEGKTLVLTGASSAKCGSAVLRGILSENRDGTFFTAFRLETDGLSLCHLGGLSGELGDGPAADIGPCDVVFMPAGGGRVCTPQQALENAGKLKAGLLFPMLYNTPSLRRGDGLLLNRRQVAEELGSAENSFRSVYELEKVPEKFAAVLLNYA